MTQALAHNLLTGNAGVGRWELDRQATKVSLAHKTMWGLLTVKGGFTQADGEGTIQAGGALTGTFHVASHSIDTRNKKRDEHLRSAEFLDAENYPQITVGIASAAIAGEDVKLEGTITVKGIREPLALTARVTEASAGWVVVTAETKIDRDRFGMSWNQLGMMKGLTTVTVTAAFRRTD
jgi:polyisoprenoid-binding protein YceI